MRCAACSACTSRVVDPSVLRSSMMPRVMVRRAAFCAAAVLFCASCNDGDEPLPPDTVGSLPPSTPPSTLLPLEVETLPPDNTVTLTPDTLFAGDLCTALEEGDFLRTTIAGVGTGRLVDIGGLADDACGFVVRAGGDDYTVVVQAATAIDLEQPGPTDEIVEELDDIGLAAVGVTHGDGTYEVIVQVSNGYFSVTTPDGTSARYLAAAAADRALQEQP